MSPEQRIETLILPQLNKVRKRRPGEWTACCPAHDDRNPSFGVAVGRDGRILMNCRSGCGIDEILGALGLSMGILFDECLGDLPPLWFSERAQKSRQFKDTTFDRAKLAQYEAMRERGERLTTAQKEDERESWMRVNGGSHV